ncbi:hypothetical protein BU16DRAFT_93784 [Lophium mytilinum]|uniref:HTH APSES-type domain-containing protein n=1 Tax=Lophium mytilinum TaxID=390894 RepID=A0A6A6QLC7_9PEZI|nr:hypothetical protein BU16DRAFT_93784 [Lophium mytilinum]
MYSTKPHVATADGSLGAFPASRPNTYTYGNDVRQLHPAQTSPAPVLQDEISNAPDKAPGSYLPPLRYSSAHQFDTTGQLCPSGMKPRVTATLWDDEGSLCFQVEAKGVCVARREDNHMINGTKLLNVAGMTRGRRDGILKSEKTRHVVKIGPMHLKGVWIPFERALDFANRERITEQLFPLFVHDIGAFLYHPTNQPHAGVGAGHFLGASASLQSPLQHPHQAMSNTPQPSHSILPHPSASRPGLDRAHPFPTPPTSASSIIGMGNQGSSSASEWGQSDFQSMSGSQSLNIDTGLSNTRSMPATPVSTPPGSPLPHDSQWCPPSQGYNSNCAVVWDEIILDAEAMSLKKHSLTEVKRQMGPPEFANTLNERKALEVKTEPLPSTLDYSIQVEPPMTSKVVELDDADDIQRLSDIPDLGEADSCGGVTQSQRGQSDLDLESKTSHFQASPMMQSEPSTAGTATSATNSSYDESSEEESFDIPARKKRMIDLAMMEFYRMFDATFGIRQVASGESAKSGVVNCVNTSNGESAKPQNAKRKAADNNGRDDGENEDDQPRKRSKPSNDDDLECQRKLACPYFKRNPRKYGNVHSCLGPGWVAIARLKEHLYRRHALPPQCTRCCQTFKSEAELKAHSRIPEGCEIRDEERLEGFDLSQEKRLRSKKRGLLGDAREDQWRDVYLILFPDALLSEIPSPYYNYDEDSGRQPINSPSSAGFARYDAYLRRELPQRVRQELEAEMEEELGLVDERLKSRLSTIVRNCLEQLCQTYKGKSPTTEEATEDETPAPTERLNANSLPGPSILHYDMAVFEIPSEACLEMWDDFMACSDIGGGEPSDSAYGSLDRVRDSAMTEDTSHMPETDESWMLPFFDSQSEFPHMERRLSCPPPHASTDHGEDHIEARSANIGKGKGKEKEKCDADMWLDKQQGEI